MVIIMFLLMLMFLLMHNHSTQHNLFHGNDKHHQHRRYMSNLIVHQLS